eukprot:scaffold37028_cov57-Attheya_sp.AAC.11
MELIACRMSDVQNSSSSFRQTIRDVALSKGGGKERGVRRTSILCRLLKLRRGNNRLTSVVDPTRKQDNVHMCTLLCFQRCIRVASLSGLLIVLT